MNRTSRTGALLGLTAGIVVAGTIPASATFDAPGASVPAVTDYGWAEKSAATTAVWASC